MRILLHTCCGPCLIYPQSLLRDEGIALTAYFFNPNIHPFREFKARREALVDYTESLGIASIIEAEYGLVDYLQAVVHREKERCRICYAMRLERTARRAKAEGFDGFSTTLLYSRYQNHELIRTTGDHFSARYAIPFLYRDFRLGWQAGVEQSKELEMYRQAYCGCIYSEQERYDKTLRKKNNKKGERNVFDAGSSHEK